jgi:hypothetical protein
MIYPMAKGTCFQQVELPEHDTGMRRVVGRRLCQEFVARSFVQPFSGAPYSAFTIPGR